MLCQTKELNPLVSLTVDKPSSSASSKRSIKGSTLSKQKTDSLARPQQQHHSSARRGVPPSSKSKSRNQGITSGAQTQQTGSIKRLLEHLPLNIQKVTAELTKRRDSSSKSRGLQKLDSPCFSLRSVDSVGPLRKIANKSIDSERASPFKSIVQKRKITIEKVTSPTVPVKKAPVNPQAVIYGKLKNRGNIS